MPSSAYCKLNDLKILYFKYLTMIKAKYRRLNNFVVYIFYCITCFPAANEDLELFNQAVIYVVVSLVVFIFAIVLLIAVIRKVNKNKGMLNSGVF